MATVAAVEAEGEVLEGIVERVLYVDDHSYTVLLLALDEHTSVKVVGNVLAGSQPGESLRVTGRHGHGVHGEQFTARTCEHMLPAGLHAIRLYLASGLIKGIGPKIAHAIVDELGAHTMAILDAEPDRLLDVYGIGPTRYASIQDAWQRHQDMRALMVLLQGAGVPAGYAPRIAAHFTSATSDIVTLVKEEPYRLVEVRGIDFTSADKLALWLGVPERSPQRLRAGILHELDQQTQRRGHTYLPEKMLLARAADTLGQDQGVLPRELDALRACGDVVAELLPHQGQDDQLCLFTRRSYDAEASLTRHLRRLVKTGTSLSRRADWTTDLTLPADAPPLHEQQERAVRMALTKPVSILTGGPGCGKSHTVATIVALAEDCGAQVTLAAPTGRAAKRLAELSGAQAMTVHRLLLARPGDTGDSLFDADPMDADLFVIDEASMLDAALCARLVAKIPTGAHLLFVGDVDQLPSIGPGNVLRDLLLAQNLPRTVLAHNFRQAQDSPIAANAHLIIRGEPTVNRGAFWFLQHEDATTLPDLVVDLVTRRLPKMPGVKPGDIQVLSPGRTTPGVGSEALARRLHEDLNPLRPGDSEHRSGDRSFRLGDRVMPVRNDRHKGPHGVFNGSVGTVVSMDTDRRELEVLLDDGDTVPYGYDELDTLIHAYAITVHRAQGSEYPVVVIPLTTAFTYTLQRNLLYTAVTRARRQLVLVGQDEALKRAINTRPAPRWTGLAQRLCTALEAGPVVLTMNGDGQITLC